MSKITARSLIALTFIWFCFFGIGTNLILYSRWVNFLPFTELDWYKTAVGASFAFGNAIIITLLLGDAKTGSCNAEKYFYSRAEKIILLTFIVLTSASMLAFTIHMICNDGYLYLSALQKS